MATRGTFLSRPNEAARQHEALLELAVRASGASGGILRLQGDGIVARHGACGETGSEIVLHDVHGKTVGSLMLRGAQRTDGLADLLSTVFARIPPDEGAFERELHHRSGNLLQTVASMLQMQVDSFDALAEIGPDKGRALVSEARMRVLIVGAVQMTMEDASQPDQRIATHHSLEALCDRLSELIPHPVRFDTELAELLTRRTHASALGIMLTEFAVAATRDAFPQPKEHRIKVVTTVFEENGCEHVSMELHHVALGHGMTGYDETEWSEGAPTLASRMVEAVAVQLDGLVAIDRDESHDDGHKGGLRLRLVFDRPVMTGDERSSGNGKDGAHFAEAHTFDTRLGVHAGNATTMRKS